MDESGDHSLSKINEDFPIFVLSGLLFEESSYLKIGKAVDLFKAKYFNTKSVILHSRDIRKCDGPFKILFDLDLKKRFYIDLDNLLKTADFKIITSAIIKNKHIAKYGKLADDPYEISLTFVLERTLFEADDNKNLNSIDVIIEGRGTKEDIQLASRYNELLYRGTGMIMPDRLLNTYSKELIAKKKSDNDNGLQLADLCAYPIARYVLNSDVPNPSFEVIRSKIRKGPKGFMGYGIKLFP